MDIDIFVYIQHKTEKIKREREKVKRANIKNIPLQESLLCTNSSGLAVSSNLRKLKCPSHVDSSPCNQITGS